MFVNYFVLHGHFLVVNHSVPYGNFTILTYESLKVCYLVPYTVPRLLFRWISRILWKIICFWLFGKKVSLICPILYLKEYVYVCHFVPHESFVCLPFRTSLKICTYTNSYVTDNLSVFYCKFEFMFFFLNVWIYQTLMSLLID